MNVFDATRPVAMQLKGPGGVRIVRVRFPSDEEWAERQRRRKVIIKSLGRGITETIVQGAEDVDAALLAKIRIDQDADSHPDVDAFEAAKLIEQLSMSEVDDVVPVGDSFRVTLRVLGATTVHLIGMPSAKDLFEYKRAFARVLDLPHGRQELTINMAPAGALYKKLITATEGYAGDTPLIHQAVVVKAAIDALETDFSEDRDTVF
jgi:hypothetical protein